MVNKKQLSIAQANLKIMLWNTEAQAMKSSEVYTWLQDIGLPEEAAIRLHDLVSQTIKIGKKIIAIGKVILVKIIEFVKAHPFLVAGAGICTVVAAVIYNFIISIPFLGQILEPVARALGIGIVLTGAVVGHTMDKQFKAIGQNIVEVASEFFQLLVDVLNTLSHEVGLA